MVNQQKKVAIGCEGGRFEIRKKNGWGLGKPLERRSFQHIGVGDVIIWKIFFARKAKPGKVLCVCLPLAVFVLMRALWRMLSVLFKS
jgi:hypothetical protein